MQYSQTRQEFKHNRSGGWIEEK